MARRCAVVRPTALRSKAHITRSITPIHRQWSASSAVCNLNLADVNLQYIPGARRCHKRNKLYANALNAFMITLIRQEYQNNNYA